MKPLKLDEMKQVRAGGCQSDSDCGAGEFCHRGTISRFGITFVEVSICWS